MTTEDTVNADRSPYQLKGGDCFTFVTSMSSLVDYRGQYGTNGPQ